MSIMTKTFLTKQTCLLCIHPSINFSVVLVHTSLPIEWCSLQVLLELL